MFDPIHLTRVVSTPAALDGIATAGSVLRTAPDEALVLDAGPDDIDLSDPHALIAADPGWMAAWLQHDTLERLLRHGAEWRPGVTRPTLAQGLLFQLPVKVWVEDERVLLLVPHTLAGDLARRIEAAP